MRKIKTIFLTGATGFVGSNLAFKFLKQGYNLKLLVRNKNETAEKRIDSVLSSFFSEPDEYKKIIKDKVEIVHGDITLDNLGIPSSILKQLSSEVDTVFHCAALTSFDEEKRKEIEEHNVKGTENVLNFTIKLKQPDFHFVSTAYVCGQSNGIFYEEDIDVGQKFNNPYEESKFKAEQLVREYKNKYDIKTTIYRPSIIVGDSKTGKTSTFFGFYGLIRALYMLIEMFKEDIKRGSQRARTAGVSWKNGHLFLPLRVGGISNKTLNLVPINCCVDVICQIYRKKDSYGKTYHITNPQPPTLRHIQHLVLAALNVSGVKVVNPNEFVSNPMNSWEEFFSEGIRVYKPYLEKEEPMFSNKNTQYILNKVSIKCPQITLNLMYKLINYCIKINWGQELII